MELKGRVLITAGPTREPLDPVRYLSNASTGAQGVALAEEALQRGWAVDLVHGPMEVPLPERVTAHAVLTAAQMLEVCRKLHPACNLVIGAAAVCDYRPVSPLGMKRKRGADPWILELVPTEDILADLGERKGNKIHVGFALETESLLKNASRKIAAKNLDWLVANPASAIGAGQAHYLILGSDGSTSDLGTITKRELARKLFDAVERGPKEPRRS
jgi:phosphopantothenoylcysteine decarboxylase/phosphopantothenate--cysteine ligase